MINAHGYNPDNFYLRKKLYINRPDRKVSPIFQIKNSSLTSGSEERHNLDDVKPYSKYTPYNYIRISNASDNDITLQINDSYEILINGNTTIGLDSEVVPAIRVFTIKNEGSTTIAENKIVVQFKKLISYKNALNKLAGGL